MDVETATEEAPAVEEVPPVGRVPPAPETRGLRDRLRGLFGRGGEAGSVNRQEEFARFAILDASFACCLRLPRREGAVADPSPARR